MEKALLPRKSPVQRRSKEMVEAILDAAARLFAAGGLAGMTTNAVAELAGVSIGSLYQYFPNKLALVRGVYERHRSRVRAAVGGGMAVFRDGLDRASLRRLAGAVLRAHRVEPELQARFEALRHEQALCGLFANDGLQELGRQLKAVLHDNR